MTWQPRGAASRGNSRESVGLLNWSTVAGMMGAKCLVSNGGIMGRMLRRFFRKRLRLLSFILAGVLGLASLGTAAIAMYGAQPIPPVPISVASYLASPPTQPPRRVVKKLVVMGDSMTAGSKNTVIWPKIFADTNNMQLELLASGGAAYTQPRKPLMDQAKKAVSLRPSVIVVAGGANDRKTSGAETLAAATDVLAYLKQAAPEATVLVVGPLANGSSDDPGFGVASDAVRSAAAATGLPFLDAFGEAWLPDHSVIQTDNVHATDEGQQMIAEKLQNKVADMGLFVPGGQE